MLASRLHLQVVEQLALIKRLFEWLLLEDVPFLNTERVVIGNSPANRTNPFFLEGHIAAR